MKFLPFIVLFSLILIISCDKETFNYPIIGSWQEKTTFGFFKGDKDVKTGLPIATPYIGKFHFEDDGTYHQEENIQLFDKEAFRNSPNSNGTYTMSNDSTIVFTYEIWDGSKTNITWKIKELSDSLMSMIIVERPEIERIYKRI